MLSFLTRRLLSGVLLLFLLTFLSYLVFELIPVNPGCMRVGCGPGTQSTDLDIRAANHQIGVDRPVVFQYGRFLWRFARHGSLGTTWTDDASVNQAIAHAVPATVSIVGGGIVLLLLLALPLGAVAALRPRSGVDRGLLAFSLVGIAVHPFVLTIVIRNVIGHNVGLPGHGYCPLTSAPSGCDGPADWASHLALPWICFALFFLPIYLRMMRVRLLETLGEPYVATARAKGASERRVIVRHVLRNAIGPVLPMVAADAGTALTAAIYLEVIFAIPGLGRLSLQALGGDAGGYDRPLVVGIVATVGLFVVLLNVASDIGGAWLDPRRRSAAPSGFFRLPRRIADSRITRIPKWVVAAGALAGATVAGVLVYTSGTPKLNVPLTGAVRTIRLDLNEHHPLNGGTAGDTVLILVRTVEFGSGGWRVTAMVTNDAHEPVTIRHGGFSLVYTSGAGRTAANAIAFSPALPERLEPGEIWAGTFGGTQALPAGRQFWVGFGTFLLGDGSTSLLTDASSVTPR